MGLRSGLGYFAQPVSGLGYMPEGREPSVNLYKPDPHGAVSTQTGCGHSRSTMNTSRGPQCSFSICLELKGPQPQVPDDTIMLC